MNNENLKQITVKTTCQRTIKNKGGIVHMQWKCNKPATHQQNDKLPLCERHYNQWLKKWKKGNNQ